jgi:peptide/nickel transport system substrate-binding protein
MDPNAGSQSFAYGWGGQNDPGFYDPAYDAACNQAISALPGEPDYEAGHLEAQRIFADQLPVVPLFLRTKLAATRPNVTGFIMDPTAASELWNIEEFDRLAEPPAPEPDDTLTVCQSSEPASLYLYDGSSDLSKLHVLEAIYDGPMDTRTYAAQAVILEKIPSLADGDAVLNVATVGEGDTVVDASGNVVTLTVGTEIIPAGEMEPITYTSGDVDLDQLVVTFTLQSGLTWSDGAPLTADDSVYAFNLLADPDTPADKFTVERTTSYIAVDDLTTRWTGLPGFKDQTFYLNFFGPAPEHVWSVFTAAELLEAEESSRAPLGWGPYVIDEWVAGDHISLHKNPTYFRAAEGLPQFDNLVYHFVGDDANAGLAALLASDCDLLTQSGSLNDSTGLYSQTAFLLELAEAGLLEPASSTISTWEHLDFGIQHISYDDGYDGGVSDRVDFFSDVRTRRAFAMCLDRQAAVDTALYGLSSVIDTYLPPEHPLYNPAIAHYDFDVNAAADLLNEVGWVDDDSDPATPRVAQGVAGVPDGTLLIVAYGTTDATLRQTVVPIYQQSLAECGIQVEVNYYPASEWFADGPEGLLFGRQFDLGEFAWLTGVQPPCDLYKSDGVPGPDGGSWIPIMDPNAGPQVFYWGWSGQNETGYYNPTYAIACKAALASLPGQAAYTANHQEVQRLLAEDLPFVPLFLRYKLAAARPELTGFILDPTEASELWNIEAFGLAR